VFGTPADTLAPPVATVATVAVAGTPAHLQSKPDPVIEAGQRLAALARRRPAESWVAIESLAVAVAGFAVMEVRGTYALSALVAFCGALLVAARTRSQLHPTSDLALWPALRSLAVVFGASSAVSVVAGDPRATLVTAGLIAIVSAVIVLGTLVARRCARRVPRVVVVGDRAAISRAAMRWADAPVQVVGGVLAEAESGRMLESIVGVPTILGLDQAAEWAAGRKADLVIVAPGHGMTGPDARALAWSLERSGIKMAVADVVTDAAPHRVRARRLGRTTVVELGATRRGALMRAGKAVVDRVCGSLLLVLATPALAVLMLAIRIDSRGPALFKQTRVGLDGAHFTMYKLRTMHTDAERQLVALRDQNEGAGLLFKMQEDPRVTRIGKLLRRTSLDELPQLINVVKGDMSLVGPRPALPREVEEYDEVEARRLAVKPGMTGLWQVSGRSNLDWETSIALDLDYVDNWRLADDLVIGLRTVGAVARARGAY
jgi:exopolysaccharide biosynthesis polyprenyl glycosylphosphotransferase